MHGIFLFLFFSGFFFSFFFRFFLYLYDSFGMYAWVGEWKDGDFSCTSRRLAHRVVPKFQNSFALLLVDSNPGQAQQCKSCLAARSKGEHRQSASPPLERSMQDIFGMSSGIGGGGGDGSRTHEERHKNLSWREANLWTKLVELRDLPAQDSLAAFPPGLGIFVVSLPLSLPLLLLRFLCCCSVL